MCAWHLWQPFFYLQDALPVPSFAHVKHVHETFPVNHYKVGMSDPTGLLLRSCISITSNSKAMVLRGYHLLLSEMFIGW